jgi:serine O-acetyltransferase
MVEDNDSDFGEGGPMAGTCVCEGAGLGDAIREDIDRYVASAERDGRSGRLAWIGTVLSFKVWAVANYRLSHALVTGQQPRILGLLLAAPLFVSQLVFKSLTGIEIDPDAHLGPGLMIPHDGTIVIGPVRVGRNCTISHGVTLGQGLLGDGPAQDDTPVLGDRVWVGPGAVIAGPIRVGSDAAVGANSVVLRDVPPRGVVLGVPSRVVSQKGSFTQIYYRGMDDDPDRQAAQDATPVLTEADPD